MGPFTEAVMRSKRLFSPDKVEQLTGLTAEHRLQTVSDMIPDDVIEYIFTMEDESSGDLVHAEEELDQVNSAEGSRYTEEQLRDRLGLEVSEELPGITKKASVAYSDTRGRYLLAAQHIRRGEIVALEQPVVAFPLARSSHGPRVCQTCFRRVEKGEGQFTCSACHAAVWCSAHCRNLAQESFHRWECRMKLSSLVDREEGGLGKLFLVLRAITQQSITFFRRCADGLLSEPQPDKGTKKGESLGSSYSTLYNLARHEAQSADQKLELNIVAIIIIRMLTRAGYFSTNCQHEELDQSSDKEQVPVNNSQLTSDQLLIGTLMITLIPIINVNSHPIHLIGPDDEQETVAAAVYPSLASTLNHSCNPSLVRASLHSWLVLSAARDIMPGEELTDMYTVHWTEWPTSTRREYLQKSFKFWCECEACKEGWDPIQDSQYSEEEKARVEQQQLRVNTEYALLTLMKQLGNNGS